MVSLSVLSLVKSLRPGRGYPGRSGGRLPNLFPLGQFTSTSKRDDSDTHGLGEAGKLVALVQASNVAAADLISWKPTNVNNGSPRENFSVFSIADVVPLESAVQGSQMVGEPSCRC